MGNIAKEGVQNTHHWSGRTETATENEVAQLDHVVIAVARVIGVVDRSRSVMCVLYTFSRNIPIRCNQLDSNLANLEATVEVW